jgi:ParB family chromosome partitioning protein
MSVIVGGPIATTKKRGNVFVTENPGKAAMAEEAARSRLGRGLAALIGDVGAETSVVERPRGQRKVPTGALRPNVRNPRRIFANAEIDELAASLRERGIIQPIVARPVRGAADAYEIIAGERRWRAAQRAGLHEVPVVVIEATDEEALQLAIIENVQRTDLNPLEEADGYRALIRDFSHSQDDVARMIGKSRSHVANTLRLQTLPDRVKEHIRAGRLSAGHARALVGHHDAERLSEEIVARGLNVREVEALTAVNRGMASSKHVAPKRKAADTVAMEKRLSDALGLVVSIDHRGEKGLVSIRYRNLEQLDDLARRLERKH